MKANCYYVGINYETKINDVLIKYISSFDDAKDYIINHKGERMLLFYQKHDITTEEHIELSKLQWNIQLYSINSNFMPCNLDYIASYLYNIYLLVFSASLFSTMQESKTLNDEDIKVINHLLDNVPKYIEDNHFIDSNIITESKNMLIKTLMN